MNDTDSQPMEVAQPSAMMAIERAQIDSQVATAKQFPRDIAVFRKRAVAMATLDAETAEACIYCRPVGKGDDGKQKFAEGPSIRMAEIVATCYGNIRVGARIVEQTPRYVKCEGFAHDLESNFAAKAEVVESTVGKNGQPYSERQAALMAKVCVSKALRDATFRVVPRALMKPVLLESQKVIAKSVPTVAERIKRIQAWIATLKIDVARVFAALGVKDWPEFTEDHFTVLTGLKTAIADGDAIDDIFPPVGGEPARNPHAPEPTPAQQAQQAQQAADTSKATTTPAANTEAKAKTKKAQSAKPATPTPAPAETKPQDPPAQEASPANNADDEKTLADMGLAPEVEPEPEPQEEADAAEPEPPQPAPAPVDEGLQSQAWWDRKPDEKDDVYLPRILDGVKTLMKASDVTDAQILQFCIENKFAKSGQKLADLSTQKLTSFGKNWKVLMPKFKAVAVK